MPFPWPLAAANTTTDWVVYLLAGMSLLYIAVIRPMMMRRKDPLSRVPQFGLAQHRELEKQMSDLLVELSNMARQITAQIDTRAKKLELLIDEADKRIAQLDAAPQDQRPPMRIAAESVQPESPPPQPGPDPRHVQIYALADEGRSPQDIAAATDRPRGEIELILALRPRQ